MEDRFVLRYLHGALVWKDELYVFVHLFLVGVHREQDVRGLVGEFNHVDLCGSIPLLFDRSLQLVLPHAGDEEVFDELRRVLV